jgi:predicted nicotinamide N-methyase
MQEKFNIIEIQIGNARLKLWSLKDFDREFNAHFEEHKADAVKVENPPLYGILWPSASGLATLLQARRDLRGKRVLEIGCGLGLPSLICAQQGADVTAMDKHWDAGLAVRENAKLNQLPLRYEEGSFEDSKLQLGTFDMIIASDILYEPNFFSALENFILRHARRPCEIIIADPGRFAAADFGTSLRTLGSFQRLEQRIEGREEPIVIQKFLLP